MALIFQLHFIHNSKFQSLFNAFQTTEKREPCYETTDPDHCRRQTVLLWKKSQRKLNSNWEPLPLNKKMADSFSSPQRKKLLCTATWRRVAKGRPKNQIFHTFKTDIPRVEIHKQKAYFMTNVPI